MREEFNVRPINDAHVDIDRKASREYLFGKKKEPEKARCCECGTVCDKRQMGWVGDNAYRCILCLMMRRNDA